MRNPFKKTVTEEKLHRPVEGRVIPLEEVPDPVFAGRSLGDGFAVEPEDGRFCAPVDGELVLVADTLHAFAVRTAAGAEILVHIGVDTVTLKGSGFEAVRGPGEQVKQGDPVITCDLRAVSDQVPSMATPVILTNGDRFVISPPALDAGAHDPVATLRRV